MGGQSDSTFLEKLRSKDIELAHGSLKSFYDENWNFAKNLMRSKGLNQMDCEDLYQDAMTIFYNKIRRSNFQLSSTLKTFLLGIITNLIYAQHRKNKKNSSLEIQETTSIADDLEQLFLLQERKNILIEKLKKLGDKCQEVLKLYYFEQISMKEIASKMNYASDNVAKNKKSHCLNKLKQSFTDKSNLGL